MQANSDSNEDSGFLQAREEFVQQAVCAASASASRLSLHVLASGSTGNASLVGCDGRYVLIDCGICKRDLLQRMDAVGVDPSSIEAVLITHEHTDHTKGLGVAMRGFAKQDLHPDIFASVLTRDASSDIRAVQDLCEMRSMRADDALSVAGMQVRVFPTSHDAAESFGFRFDTDGDSLGFMTDTGIVTPQAHDALFGCRILAIESNHDTAILASGDYPEFLKSRIAGDRGHLSNNQSAVELERLLDDRLEEVVAMHISQNNNTFGLPPRVLAQVLERNDFEARVQAGLPRTPISVQ